MKRLKVLAVLSSLFVFAAAGVANAEMTTIYGPVYVTKTVRESNNSGGATLKFTAPVPGNGVIMIKNGVDPDRSAHVSSAKIELNGVTISNESDFNKNTDTIEYNVTLQAENEMEVEVESCMKCALEVTVLGEGALPPRVLPTR